MDTFTVSFFGHRYIDNPFPVDKALDELIGPLLRSKEYVEFLVGRNGDLTSLCPLPFVDASGRSGTITAPMCGYCPI